MLFFFTDYVVDIYDTLTTTPKEELKSLAEDLKEEVPAPLPTMLVEKESKEEAITKYKQRKEKETVICPPTCTRIIIIKQKEKLGIQVVFFFLPSCILKAYITIPKIYIINTHLEAGGYQEHQYKFANISEIFFDLLRQRGSCIQLLRGQSGQEELPTVKNVGSHYGVTKKDNADENRILTHQNF